MMSVCRRSLLKATAGLILPTALVSPQRSRAWIAQSSAVASPGIATPLLWSGTGSSNPVTGAGFQPDLAIIKARNATTGWRWVDSSRGATVSLDSTSTAIEATEASGLTSFDADGFTVGSDTDYNNSGVNYVGYAIRKLSGAFNIVTYAGNGIAGRTVAHGLGVAPEMMIIKRRNTTANWRCYHGGLNSPSISGFIFNGNGTGNAAVWNSTAPDSSNFTLGASSEVNASGSNYIAWVFASMTGVCAVGGYNGTGGTNGPAVTVGFQPRIVLLKANQAATDWLLFDDVRDNTSPHATYSVHHSTNVEGNMVSGCDMTSTGFQIIGNDLVALTHQNLVRYAYFAAR